MGRWRRCGGGGDVMESWKCGGDLKEVLMVLWWIDGKLRKCGGVVENWTCGGDIEGGVVVVS